MKEKSDVHIKGNSNSHDCQCVVGQRSAMHQTSEMVTSILFGVSERPTRIGAGSLPLNEMRRDRLGNTQGFLKIHLDLFKTNEKLPEKKLLA